MLLTIGDGKCQLESPKVEAPGDSVSCHDLAVKQHRREIILKLFVCIAELLSLILKSPGSITILQFAIRKLKSSTMHWTITIKRFESVPTMQDITMDLVLAYKQ